MWLPSLQAGGQGGLWDAICRAAGIYRPSTSAFKATAAAQVPTTVAWNVETVRMRSHLRQRPIHFQMKAPSRRAQGSRALWLGFGIGLLLVGLLFAVV